MRKSGWPATSSSSRGYGAAWQALRLQVLRRDNGLCQCDRCKGGQVKVSIATEVHHRIPKSKGGTDSMDNLVAMNAECHKREDAANMGRTLRQSIGVDGYPKA